MRDSKGRFIKGFRHSDSSRERIVRALTGRPVSKATREKLRQSNVGKKHGPHTEAFKLAVHVRHIGKKNSIETRRRMAISKMGARNPQWRGGKTSEAKLIRSSMDYKLWREAVMTRDGYQCIWCIRKGGWSRLEKRQIRLNADHILPFCLYPELRFAIDNGRTLCEDCHKKTSTYGISAERMLQANPSF